MPKKYSLYVSAISFAFFVTILLSEAPFLDALSAPRPAISRGKRQITYAKPQHDRHSSNKEKEEEEEEELRYLERITPRKPLPQHSIYPGDLSGFFVINNTSNVTEIPKTSSTQSSKAKSNKRSKRGAYLRDKFELDTMSTRNSAPKQSKPRFSETRRHESIDTPSEMSFSGAGYLRPEDNDINNSPPSQSDYPLVGNRRAEEDFQAAFHPEYGRNFEAVQFDDDIRHPGTLVSEKLNSEPRNAFKNDQKVELGSPSSPPFSVLPQKTLSESVDSFFPAIPSQYSNMAGMNSFFYSSPFGSSGQLATAADSTGFDIHESLLKNHRLNTGALSNHATGASLVEKQQVAAVKTNTITDPRKIRTGRKRRSTYSSESHYQDVDYDSKGKASEARHDYRYSRSEDRHDSASGYIPLTGTFEGGALHLSLPYYGRPMPPPSPYSSGPSMHYNSYGPRRPQPRHYGPGENYFHPSEARRYSYGILGSGNFEVIRGGVYSGESPRGMNSITFDDGRSSYGGEIFNNYGGGTTEIIIDGPIQGFQGFDNFPTHLINALSKHSEIAVRGPER